MPELERTWVRFVDGRRPLRSGITTRFFLQWCSEKLLALGKKVLVLMWENARAGTFKPRGSPLDRQAQPGSQEGAEQGRGEDRQLFFAQEEEPVAEPYRTEVDPRGKRKVVEPKGLLGAHELAERVCPVFGCPHYEHLSLDENVS